MVKGRKGLALKKRKGEATSAPADSKRQATGSSEKTQSEIPTPRSHGAPPFAAEDIDVAAAGKLVMGSASSEPDLAVTGVQTATPIFPTGVDTALEDYNLASSVIKNLLKGSVAKYERAIENVKILTNDKAKLVKEVTSASVREEELKSELAAARAELATTKEEVAAARTREQEAAAAQGGILRALAERMFLSKRFSALVRDVTEPANIRAIAEVLDLVAADFPDLDKGKYGYQILEDDEMLRIYYRKLVKNTSAFPVIEHLAGKSTPLTVEEVTECPVDRDLKFEALLGPFREELETCPVSPYVSDVEGEEEEEEAVQKDAKVEVSKSAEVRQPNTEAEPSGGVS